MRLSTAAVAPFPPSILVRQCYGRTADNGVVLSNSIEMFSNSYCFSDVGDTRYESLRVYCEYITMKPKTFCKESGVCGGSVELGKGDNK